VLKLLQRLLPFLTWFSGYSRRDLRADLISGLTVALVLIPQSMAYAQLAGLPGYYGLYAAFLPPMVAALFGSSRQLQTGPVAVVSLMTSASLEPLATAGSAEYIAYAVLLAFIVGAFQLTLGLLRLGVLVDFLSHPVVNGFTNAAAIIIATSQLSKIFGVYVDKAAHHYETVWRVVVAATHYTHWPTLGLAALSFGIMYGLRRLNPKIPGVLVAVVVCTLLSWGFHFQKDVRVSVDAISVPVVRRWIRAYDEQLAERERAATRRTGAKRAVERYEREHPEDRLGLLERRFRYEKAGHHLTRVKERLRALRRQIRGAHLERVKVGGRRIFVRHGDVPDGAVGDGRKWRIMVAAEGLDPRSILLRGGGAVVGKIPRGLPSLSAPRIDLSVVMQLLSSAVIISLLGFMEAISIAKAMAARSGQRLDANQELVGQGLGNLLGAFGQSYAVSGSFSRSAVNFQAGAVSGLSSVFTSGMVVVTLLFFTPLLFHLPQSVLASVIMMAVLGLVNVGGFVHAWRANRFDGAISLVSFVATLAFAPHLDVGILIGVVLSLMLYLRNSMRPHVARLSLHPDGSLRDADRHNLKCCRRIALIRVDGALFFANANFLEQKVMQTISQMPELRMVIIVGNGINDIDASGEEVLARMVEQIRERGIDVGFSGLKTHVVNTLRRTHLFDKVGEDHFYPTQVVAVSKTFLAAHEASSDEEPCPLERIGSAALRWLPGSAGEVSGSGK